VRRATRCLQSTGGVHELLIGARGWSFCAAGGTIAAALDGRVGNPIGSRAGLERASQIAEFMAMISRQPKPFINGALGIFQPLRCRVCRWTRSQSYKVDFKPESLGGVLFLHEPLYACHRCARRYRSDERVARVTRRLTELEVTS